MKYGRSRPEKVEDVIGDYLKFKEENYEDDDELILVMKELTQRRVELRMSFEEFCAVWRLEKMRKRRKMEGFELQFLRNVVKESGPNVVTNFENIFKEIKIEGKRKDHNSSSYAEKLPSTHYTAAEHREIETLYKGKESLSRQIYQRSRSQSLQRGQSQERRQKSLSRNGYNYSRFQNQPPRSRYDQRNKQESQDPGAMDD